VQRHAGASLTRSGSYFEVILEVQSVSPKKEVPDERSRTPRPINSWLDGKKFRPVSAFFAVTATYVSTGGGGEIRGALMRVCV
jgi:hypothetical protein